jgi:hypothetical protein
MARYSSAYRAGGAGSITLPMASLYAAASTPLWLVEVWVTNTTVTALSMAVREVTTAGTQGAAQVVKREEESGSTLKGDPRDVHTVAPTIATGSYRNGSIGASIGSGWTATFGGRGLWIPGTAGVGVALMPLVGTGQICDVTWVWDA